MHLKAVLRWRQHDALAAFDRPDVEIAVTDPTDTVISRQRGRIDEFGTTAIDLALGSGAALGVYGITVSSGDAQASGAFEVQEYRRPEFEVIVTIADRFVVQGNEVVADVQARYYFGQPVANGRVHYVVDRQPYFSPFRFSDDADPDDSGGFYGGDVRSEGDVTLGADGRGQIRLPLDVDDNGRDYRARIEARVTDGSGREVSGAGLVQATYGSFLVATRLDQYMARPGASVTLSARTLDYTGAARPDVAVRVLVERLDYADGYYSAPTVTPSQRHARQHRCRRPALGTDPRAGTSGELPRRRRRPRGPARSPRRRLAVGAGGVRYAGHDRQRVPRAAGRQAQLRPGRHRADRGPRPRHRRAGAADQGGPARVVAPGGAPDRRRRVRDSGDRRRSRRRLRQRGAAARRAAAAVGTAAGGAAGLAHAPDRFDAGPAGGQAPGTGELCGAGDRRRGSAGAGQRQPGGDRRIGVRREGRRHARPGPRLLPPRVPRG